MPIPINRQMRFRPNMPVDNIARYMRPTSTTWNVNDQQHAFNFAMEILSRKGTAPQLTSQANDILRTLAQRYNRTWNGRVPNNKVNAAQKLVSRISKKWPTPSRLLGSGTNGITFLTSNTPPKVLKIALGNARREVAALQKLAAAGANFIPRLTGNFVNIRKNTNNNLKKILFPASYSLIPGMNTPETTRRRGTVTMYVMNKVGNVSLWSHVKKSRPGNSNKRVIRSEIQRAVNFMHKHGISHGDLHSGNILVELDAAGRMKKLWVIDFGRYVNIPVGSNEKKVYNTLNKEYFHQNYNLFNNKRKPMVMLYNGPTGPVRANRELMKEMYGVGGSLSQIKNVI